MLILGTDGDTSRSSTARSFSSHSVRRRHVSPARRRRQLSFASSLSFVICPSSPSSVIRRRLTRHPPATVLASPRRCHRPPCRPTLSSVLAITCQPATHTVLRPPTPAVSHHRHPSTSHPRRPPAAPTQQYVRYSRRCRRLPADPLHPKFRIKCLQLKLITRI